MGKTEKEESMHSVHSDPTQVSPVNMHESISES